MELKVARNMSMQLLLAEVTDPRNSLYYTICLLLAKGAPYGSCYAIVDVHNTAESLLLNDWN